MNRFDLEQQIIACWAVVDDIQLIYDSEHLYINENEMQNALLGLHTLYSLKFEKMFKTFESLIRDGVIK